MIPISFPYRDMGTIRDLIDLYNFKEKEKRAEKSGSILTHNFSIWKPVKMKL